MSSPLQGVSLFHALRATSTKRRHIVCSMQQLKQYMRHSQYREVQILQHIRTWCWKELSALTHEKFSTPIKYHNNHKLFKVVPAFCFDHWRSRLLRKLPFGSIGWKKYIILFHGLRKHTFVNFGRSSTWCCAGGGDYNESVHRVTDLMGHLAAEKASGDTGLQKPYWEEINCTALVRVISAQLKVLHFRGSAVDPDNESVPNRVRGNTQEKTSSL